jgi:4-aminobutyrate aminotransferase
MGALSLTASKPQQRRRFAPLVPGVSHVPYPNVYRGCAGGQEEQEAYALSCARFIEEKLFRSSLAPEEVAAIVVEAIQGEAGYLVAPSVFLQEIRNICDRHGILMVVDEVQSGSGRTGKWWAIEHSGVQPDIITMAKGIASGMPLGVCMSKAQIMDWIPGSHASTFGGNPVCLAAALATFDILEREAIANAAAVGSQMMERMKPWVSRYQNVGDVRGRGLMLGVEIVRDKESRAPAAPERDAIIQMAFERGLLLLGSGENTIRLSPALIVTGEEANAGLDILEACIEKTGLRP